MNALPHHIRDSQVTPGTGFPVQASIRDALLDRIPLGEPEIALISTPPFLRLERIQQLGFVSRIWPGAKHARYEHSIGVFHLARMAVERLRLESSGSWITEGDARTLSAAALLHDIGHYPFSHAIEELGDPIASHEVVGRAIIESEPIASVLVEQWNVDPHRVSRFVSPDPGTPSDADRVLRGLLSGPLDVDKLDYLPRDAGGCGVPYGGVDTARLIDSLRVATVPGDRRKRIVIDAKGVSPLHSLINARQEMFDNVYWHHANRSFMAMLLRSVQEALLAGAITPQELTTHDDASLLQRLSETSMPAETRNLVASIRDRTIHKRAIEFSSKATDVYSRLGELFNDPARRLKVESAMTMRLGRKIGRDIDPASVLIDIPKPEKWKTDVWVQFRRPPVGFTSIMPWRDVVGLTDNDFKRFEESRRLIRIVARREVRDDVSRHWRELLVPELPGNL